jgi:hypothetical protein
MNAASDIASPLLGILLLPGTLARIALKSYGLSARIVVEVVLMGAATEGGTGDDVEGSGDANAPPWELA